MPDGYALSPAYPNPFNPQTAFELVLRQSQNVVVQVFDMQGRLVHKLFQGSLPAYTPRVFRFDASQFASGVYFIRVQGASFTETRTVTLVK